MRAMRPARVALVVCLACLAVPGCGRDRGPAYIGFAFDIANQSVRVIQDELAAWDGARSPAISMLVEPQGQISDPADVEIRRAQHLASVPGVAGVVGHGGSRSSLTAAPVYNGAGIVQIVPTGTSRILRASGRWTFMLAADDSAEGAFIGAFLHQRLAARRVAVFYVRDEYGLGLRDGLVAELRARGVSVIDEVPFEVVNNLQTLVSASLRRGMPDAVVVAGRAGEAARIARFLHQVAPAVRVVVGDGALVAPILVELAGPALDSIYAVAFWLPDAPDSLSRAFVARFRRLVGRDPAPHEAMAHDAVMVLAAAIRAVGTKREAIHAYLRQLGGSRPPFRGVTGAIAFGPGRDARFTMARLRGGRPVRVADQ